ncbi:hypothetical protein T08_2638 [Trichinella sp. T8]|nr:hypothetical protein T08_2638 [Trichinella sp. T8]
MSGTLYIPNTNYALLSLPTLRSTVMPSIIFRNSVANASSVYLVSVFLHVSTKTTSKSQTPATRKIEQKTGRIRDEIAVMSAIQIFISLFASSGEELLVVLLCLAYPAVKILTELESIEKVKSMQWMFSSVTFGLP